jgi:nifR3 family TIM-barrel protein
MIPRVLLAPLSGVSDLSFRLICREHGARFCFYEMLDSRALLHGLPGTLRMLDTHRKDSPIAAQLLGSDPAIMLEAAQKLVGLVNISFLDINAACPAPKVIKKGAGARLLDEPDKLGRMIGAVSSNIAMPVTVKLRSAYTRRDTASTVRTARICRDSGAAVIFLHGRTRPQGYSGDVDYDVIRAVKTALDIPVYGSGDITTPPLAKRMFDETACDGVIVARGALGNPWIFRDIENYLENGRVAKEKSLRGKKAVLRKHLAYLDKYKRAIPPDKIGIMRKVAMWYVRSLPYARRIRERINTLDSYAELTRYISSL